MNTKTEINLKQNINFEEKKSETKPYHSSFIFNNLPLNAGITIGNFLRRSLLSSIKGIAIFAIRIFDGVEFKRSKFDVLKGSKETVPYLILNLKDLIFQKKSDSDDTVYLLKLKVENKEEGEKIVKASDFEGDDNIEIMNKDLYLTTLAPNSFLEVEIYCRSDIGYKTSEEQKKEREGLEKDNVIGLDSDYSPIRGGLVTFKVNPIIATNLLQQEQLILSVETKGYINPKKALNDVLEYSKNLFENLLDLTKIIKN